MKLGPIQRIIVRTLYAVGDTGAFFGSTTRIKELQGLDLQQVERALESLIHRDIIYQEGISHKLSSWVYAKYSADEIRSMTSSLGQTRRISTDEAVRKLNGASFFTETDNTYLYVRNEVNAMPHRLLIMRNTVSAQRIEQFLRSKQ